MPEISRLVAKIAADDRDFVKAMKQSGINAKRLGQEMKVASRMIDQGMDKNVRSVRQMGDSLRTLKRVAVVALVGWGIRKIGKSFLDAAKEAEGYRVRLNTLLGSVQEGNRAFSEMSDIAGKLPYQYSEVMSAATSLAGVMRGGVDEIKHWMPMIADLAAVSGLTLQETTSQIIRMYSAGAAAADMFRERGILAMMGFEAGVRYTAEETREMMFTAWEDVNSKFRGVTDDLAKNWEGTMSMFGDLWFQFRNMVMDSGPFQIMKEQAQELLVVINRLKDEGKLDVWAKQTGIVIVKTMTAAAEAVQKVYEAYKALQWGMAQLISGTMNKLADFYDWLGRMAAKISDTLAQPYIDAAETLRQKAKIWSEVAEANVEDFDKINAVMEKLINRIESASTSFQNMGNEGTDAANRTIQATEDLEAKLKQVEEIAIEFVKDRNAVEIEEEKNKNEKILSEYNHMLENMHDSTSDFIYDIMDGQIKSWRDMFDRVLNYFKRLLADMVAQAMLKPIVLPIIASITGMAGLTGTAMAMEGGGTVANLLGMGGLANMSGLGALGLGGLLSTPLWGGSALMAAESATSITGGSIATNLPSSWVSGVGPSLGATMGAGLLGYLGYSTIGDMLGLPQGRYSGLGSGLGGAGGFMLGGPIGAGIGALLGGLLGSVVGPGDPTMDLRHAAKGFGTQWMPGQGLGLSTQDFGYIGGGQGPAIQQVSEAYKTARNTIVNSFNQQMLSLAQTLGGDYSKIIEDTLMTKDFYYQDTFTFYIHDAEAELERQLENFAEFLDETVQKIYNSIIPQYVTGEIMGSDYYSKLAPDIQQQYQGLLTGGGLGLEDQLGLLASFEQGAAAYEQLIFQMESAAGLLSDLEIAQFGMNQQFDAWINTLNALGISESEIAHAEELRIQALNELAIQYGEVDNAITEVVNNIVVDIEALNAAFGNIEFQVLSMTGQLSELEIGTYRINQQFSQWITTLTELGATAEQLAWIEEQRGLALQQLADDIAAALQAEIDARQAAEAQALANQQAAIAREFAARQAAWQRERESIYNQWLDLLTSSANPADVQERMRILESQFAPVLTATELPKYQAYLELAQQAYQRPSIEYQNIFDMVVSAFARFGGIPSYQWGGEVAHTGLAWVHEGERVLEAGDTGSNFNFNIDISVNGANDPYTTGIIIEDKMTEFLQGKARRIIQDSAKYAQ